MRYILFFLMVIACLFVHTIVSHADEPAGQPAPSVDELQKEITTLRAARVSGDKASTYMAWAALVSLALKVVVDRVKKIPENELTDKAKHAIPWIVSGLGAAGAVAWKYSTGETWTNAIILGGAGPGSILVDNLWSGFIGLITKKPNALTASVAALPRDPPSAA